MHRRHWRCVLEQVPVRRRGQEQALKFIVRQCGYVHARSLEKTVEVPKRPPVATRERRQPLRFLDWPVVVEKQRPAHRLMGRTVEPFDGDTCLLEFLEARAADES